MAFSVNATSFRGFCVPGNGLFLDKSLRAKAFADRSSWRFVAAIDKSSQIANIHSAKRADIGHGRDL